MVAAFLDSEEAQLAAAVAFIRANHLDDELRDHRWAAFGMGYKGAGYRRTPTTRSWRPGSSSGARSRTRLVPTGARGRGGDRCACR